MSRTHHILKISSLVLVFTSPIIAKETVFLDAVMGLVVYSENTFTVGGTYQQPPFKFLVPKNQTDEKDRPSLTISGLPKDVEATHNRSGRFTIGSIASVPHLVIQYLEGVFIITLSNGDVAIIPSGTVISVAELENPTQKPIPTALEA